MLKLLLEIGTEEIPAAFIPPALKQLESIAAQLLTEARLSYKNIATYATPRRLSFIVEGLAEFQPDLTEEIKGPPVRIAIDGDGKLTKAGQGFARKLQIDSEDLITKELKGQEYLYAIIKTFGKPANEILPDLLVEIINKLSFPKPMRWGTNTVKFARPIRWLIALLNDNLIPINFANITANRYSRSHRFLGTGNIEIKDVSSYLETLKNNYVIADLNERRKMIIHQIQDLEKTHNLNIVVNEDLLEEVVCLIEYPTAFMGCFNDNYLAMPEEAIITPMREHQRYFPVRQANGKLAPHFVGVRNGTNEHIENVIRGNEKVLAARLADARFFFDEDRKHKLAYYLEKLKPVVFQEKLGTIFEKALRVVALTDWLAEKLQVSETEAEHAHTAARLCKADLTTNMVYEFPELQGVMGEKYALHEGYSPNVAQAIREHYMPNGADDDLPQTTAGKIVALADKIDTVVGCLAVGLKVSGSQDPYGLRRIAAGVSKILIENQISLSLTSIIDKALSSLNNISNLNKNVHQDVLELFETRLRHLLQNEQGHNYDVVDSVLSCDIDDIYAVFCKASALSSIKQAPAFSSLITAFKRANNLANKSELQTLNPELLQEDAEKYLYQQYKELENPYHVAIAGRNYEEAFALFATLEKPINLFFDKVMVMDKDEQVRNNRLALLQAIVNLTATHVDLTKIVVE